jgi:hypothetical protein
MSIYKGHKPGDYQSQLDNLLGKLSDPALKKGVVLRDELADTWGETMADFIVTSVLVFNRLDKLGLSPEATRDALADGLHHWAYELHGVLFRDPPRETDSRYD